MTKFIPFPLERRTGLVRHTASVMAGMDVTSADYYLVRQLEQEQEMLQDLGVDQNAINETLIALAQSVRAQLWHEVLSKPGGAA